MVSIQSAFSSTTSTFFFTCVQKASPKVHAISKISKIRVIASSSGSKLMSESRPFTATKRLNLGFKDLAQTFLVDVHRAEGRPLNLKLNAPLSIGSMNVEDVENVAIRVELASGCVGWGEVAVLPEDRTVAGHTIALAKAKEACEFLYWSTPMTLTVMLNEIGLILPGSEFASVRAGVEMALIDAVANSIDVPLWRLFGGVSNSLITTITLPTESPAEATELAAKYYQLGFQTLKCMIGKNLDADIKALQAIQEAHPHCSLMLDVNEGYAPKNAIDVLHKLNDSGIRPILFEQPVHGDDFEGLREVSNVARGKYGIFVAADESCSTMVDVERLIRENIVDVINVKLAKFGVMGAFEITQMARKAGIKLMISGTIESRIATGFASHLAAGLQCFEFICLDAPFLLSEDPVIGGFEASGPLYKLSNARGQGGFLKWDMTSL